VLNTQGLEGFFKIDRGKNTKDGAAPLKRLGRALHKYQAPGNLITKKNKNFSKKERFLYPPHLKGKALEESDSLP